jgi:class 3 adenylate cyclase/tetratricopeptide (TPR) repeat protein
MTGDLAQWLDQLGLGEHAPSFAAQGIDWDVLGDLTEADLRELGLTLGARKRLLKARAALTGEVAAPTAPAPAAEGGQAERRQLTVMFVDLIDSSPLAARFDPEVMRQVLGAFHQACVDAIEAQDGHIAQYSGDGLLVYFGYPQAHEDDAVRAVAAGLALIDNLRGVNERLMAEHAVSLRVRLGIETGLVVAGEVGAGSARDKRAIVGETPIVAARLQTLAPPDTVVVGPATERLIDGSFVLEPMGARQLKGVPEPIEVYRIVSRTEAIDSFEIRAVRGLTPLVGRNAELDMLRQRWSQSRDGEMRGVLLIGEPGIGKSRLLRAFRDSCAADDHDLISLHCTSYHHDSPFWPVLQQLGAAFGLDARAFAELEAPALEAALAPLGADVAETALVLAHLFGMPAASRYAALDTASPAFKRRTLNALVSVVAAMAGHGPVLLVIEDAHWIDPSTLEFVRLALERLTETRLFVLLTARPEFKPDWTYPHLIQLNLDRLSRRDRLEMIERLTAGKALPGSVLDQIVAKTDGVPLFVEELTKAVLQGGMLRDAGEHYELSGAGQAIAVPDTLQGSLLSRLDRLDPGVKEIALVAASIGREFDRRLLSLVSGRSEGDLQTIIDHLVAAEIVMPATGSEGGGAYLFRHALIQDIAYNSLLLARRRQHHGQIAAALEAHYPEIVERQPELIARNLAESDTPQRSIDYWRRAGAHAVANAAYEEALAHIEHGLRLAAALPFDEVERAQLTVPLLLVRADTEYRLGSRQTIQTNLRAAELARRHALPALFIEATMAFAHAEAFLEGIGLTAVSMLDEALAMIGEEDGVQRCRLLGRLATTLHMTGAFDRADDVTQEAIAVARRLGDAPGLVDALSCEIMHIGARPISRSDFAERRRVLAELSDTADAEGNLQQIGNISARSLTAHLEIGDYDGFVAALARYNAFLVKDPEAVMRWIGIGVQAMHAMLLGDFALAERKAEESSDLADSTESRFSAGVFGMQMFTIRREQGRLAQVAPLIKRFVDENPDEPTWRPGLMLIASDLGFDAPARRTLDTMAETDFSIPHDSKRLVTLTYVAEVAARCGEPGHAERVYQHLLPFKDQAVTVPSFTLCCGSAARYLGLLAGSLGDWSAAEGHFEYALQMNEQMNAWPWLAHTQHEYALMLLARDRKGDRMRAGKLIARAAEAAGRLQMFALDERIRGADSRSTVKN